MPGARYALVGDPVAASPSPAMHNAAFAALGIDAAYELRPARLADAPSVLDELARGVFRGVNVTTPLKMLLAPAATLGGAAARARAVNTLWREGGRLLGALTDVDGVLEPLSVLGATHGEGLVLGSGGAARAAALALEALGLRVHFAARRPDEAARLGRELALARPGEVLALDDGAALARLFPRLEVVVQATPVGRAGEDLPLPWPRATAGLIAFEMLYRPRETAFLAAARRHGARRVEGWEMLLAQGAKSFELWTGREAPRAVMRSALLAALGP